ncbi:CZB domain-containing protein [Salmonella enterica]|nr:CZB domain-containing protein [Salmonella enterica]
MPAINDEDVFKYIYRTLQNKFVHVQYTAEKAIRLHNKMCASAAENKEITEEIVCTINQMHSLRERIKTKIPSLSKKEKRYGDQVIALLDHLIMETTGIQNSVLHSAQMMTTSASSLQITVLKAVHYQWRERVYMSLLNKTNTLPDEDEHHCMLGRWYDGEGKEKFGLLPAFIRLGDVHRKLHHVAAELTREDISHPGEEQILNKLEAFETTSQSVIAALDALDDNILK